MEDIKLKARELRKNMTPQEIKLWQIIRNKHSTADFQKRSQPYFLPAAVTENCIKM